ncbi:uncharacterized protein LOC116604645 [Nematostella vectensis]|uniref:uncharacterized protein LOC116604645 n=1 Tax=Nematostella vectensis TaxID=45351 RepID=UPI0013903734|nr:uncharacterized protein LOC116604645 [Nematostella vectensis]
MSSAFSDQGYSKLPPIRKDTAEGEVNAFNSQLRGFNRKSHGLVRLPPLQSQGNSPTTVEERQPRDETKPLLYQHRNNSASKSGELSPKTIHRPLFDKSVDTGLKRTGLESQFPRKEHASVNSDQTPLLFEENSDDSDPDENWQTKLSSSLDQRGAQAKRSPFSHSKLHQSKFLAKSSPNLSSYRRKPRKALQAVKSNNEKRGDNRGIESVALHDSDTRHELLNIGDLPFSTNQQRPTKKAKGLIGEPIKGSPSRVRNLNDEQFYRKARSHPNTPLIPDLVEHQSSRKSLGDIESVAHGLRRSSFVPPKKQNLLADDKGMVGLRVEGKLCPRNERRNSRTPNSPRSSDSLQVNDPASRAKRPSIYDLQQILSELNKEATAKGNLSNKEMSLNVAESDRKGSVYDLKEFLLMPPTKVPEQNREKGKHTKNDFQKLSVTVPEEAEERRGSAYSLMEFLSLNPAKTNNGFENEKQEKEETLKASASLNTNSGNLAVDTDTRRSSVYDLMEFLTLARENEEIKRRKMHPKIPTETPADEPGTNADPTRAQKGRSESVYDLKEFLTMARTLPKGKDAGKQNAHLLSPKSPKPSGSQTKRESIYDLNEFLAILQKEADRRRANSSINQATSENSTNDPSKPDISNDSSAPEPVAPIFTFDTLETGAHQNRAMSLYDLRDFLCAGQPQSPLAFPLNRKASAISQSSIMFNLSEDENGNGSVEEVFLALPNYEGNSNKRGSVYDLKEFLGILNNSDSPLRRRLSSISTGSESNSSQPSPVSRHDSEGSMSMYNLNEFLSLQNDDSDAKKTETETSPSLSRHDSGGTSSLYDLQEFLPILNEIADVRSQSDKEGPESVEGDVIRIQVPQLGPRAQTNPESWKPIRKRMSAPKGSLNSVPETSEVSSSPTDDHRASLEHCL